MDEGICLMKTIGILGGMGSYVISKIFSADATKEILEYQYETGYGANAKEELMICRKILLDSKAYIEELIQMNEIEAAKNELEEWMQLLPNDQEIKKFIEIVDSKS